MLVFGFQSTFDKAYSKLLTSLENGAQDHMILADSLGAQVVEEIKKLERKNEELKKQVSMHAGTTSPESTVATILNPV